MKKLILIAISAFLALFFFSSCNKDKDGNELITVNGKAAEVLTMDPQGDSQTVVVRGTQAWQAESAEWITVHPLTGPANTDVTVTISVEANEGEERLGGAIFTLTSSEFVDVLVNQAGIPQE